MLLSIKASTLNRAIDFVKPMTSGLIYMSQYFMRTELSKSSFRSLDFITVPLKSPPVNPERYIEIIQIGVFEKN